MGKPSSQSSTTKSAPWGPQKPFLTYGFDQAKQAYDAATAAGGYTGPWTAGFTPDQNNAFGMIRNYTTGMGDAVGKGVTAAGLGGLGANNTFLGNASSLYGRSMIDPTDQIIANAAKYADNPYLSGQIDAALRDVTRNFGIQNGQNAFGYSETGNGSSSRAGVVDALTQRDAMDRAADISSQMRSQAYGTGLGLGASTWDQQFNQGIAANAQTGAGADRSLDFINTGGQLTSANMANLLGAGDRQQQQNQATIQGNQAAADYNQNNQLDLIGKYMAMISGNYGGTTKGTMTPATPGVGQQILGGVLGLGGIGASMVQPFKIF